MGLFVAFHSNPRRSLPIAVALALAVLVLLLAPAALAAGAGSLQDYLPRAQPSDFFAGADRFGDAVGSPPIVPVRAGQDLKGYVYLNTDFSNATGYSGKPIEVLVGIDTHGVIAGLKLVDHKEPIVLVGIPEKRIVEAVNTLVGKDMVPVASGAAKPPQVDIVSGATVTVLVMGDSVVRSAVKLIKSSRLGGTAPVAQAAARRSVASGAGEIRDWQSLLGDGSVRHLHLSVGEVNEAFARSSAAAAQNPEQGAPDDTFIDLYVGLASVPAIGRSLLGEDGYARLKSQLKPGQQAIVVAGDGLYSFKGSGYVRGGIFDRIELLQDGASTRFRDKNHTRLGALAAEGAPDLREIALFTTPAEFTLDPVEAWQLQLLVQRATGAREKAFLTFELGYTLPPAYVHEDAPQVAVAQGAAPKSTTAQSATAQTATAQAGASQAGAAQAAIAPASAASAGGEADEAGNAEDEPLWQMIWRSSSVSIGITIAAVLALTAIFFFQDMLVKRPVLYTWVRRSFLLFTLVWLGWYANAQLSVVNVLTFVHALATGFHWEFFLAAPLIFVLWAAIAAALLFWGRGPFCGWLCPFGALQELTNDVAQWLKVPQVKLPWGLHERLWPLKYIIFLALFGLSLHSVGMAETFAEVEPFKTAIILKFMRPWPFVLFALAVLAAGLFVERFYCRYLCPLGAALAIPGRLRMFDWLKRWSECGSPCQRCAKECPVQSIHPEGHINPNECISCLHCQVLYHDDQRCPHMVQVRVKREKFEALSSPSMRAGGSGHKPVVTHNGKPRTATPALADASASPSNPTP